MEQVTTRQGITEKLSGAANKMNRQNIAYLADCLFIDPCQALTVAHKMHISDEVISIAKNTIPLAPLSNYDNPSLKYIDEKIYTNLITAYAQSEAYDAKAMSEAISWCYNMRKNS